MTPRDKTPSQPAELGQRRKDEVDLRLSLVDPVGLGWRYESGASQQLSRAAIVGAAESLRNRPGALLLGGADPLRRSDLLELLGDLARIRPERLGLCAPGEGVSAEVAQRLRDAGMSRVHVPFHCARQDAHDWLVRRPGALKVARRALRAFVDAEIPVTAEIVVTRPTMPHLAETIEVLARIGVRSVCLRRLTRNEVDGVEFVPLSPRLDLLGASLEEAAAVALGRRMRIVLRDFPVCVAPRLRPLFAGSESELWLARDGSTVVRSAAGRGCPSCPGQPHCAGTPLDYVGRFGWEEMVDPQDIEMRLREDVEEQQSLRLSAPMVFAWRAPRRVRCEACADHQPSADIGKGQPAHESTRVVRARLVEAARYRPEQLRLVGADLLAHPQAPQLLYDAVRLFPRVNVAGEASPIVEWSDLDLRRIKDLHRFDVALFGYDAATHDAHCGIPGAFAATMRAVERLRDEARIPVGAYAILHDAAAVPGFADGWASGSLPGEPRFRLSALGGSLDDLAETARALAAGPVREALWAVLPRCSHGSAGGRDGAVAPQAVREQAIDCGRSVSYRPCGSDPAGAFEPCLEGEEICVAAGCPGTAVGWRSTARSKQCTVNT